MNLDDLDKIRSLDSQGMLDQMDGLPDQLEQAWELGQRLDLPTWKGVQHVMVAGMGGSAIGADLLAAYGSELCRVPISVHRDYELPAWVQGSQTLVIASSHSGNTEETLSAFQAGVTRGARLLAIARGGALAEAARSEGVPLWRFEHQGQPRAAVGFSFGLLLAVLARLDLIPDPTDALRGAAAAMRAEQEGLRVTMPAARNMAKRMAGQLMGRWVSVFGSGVLAPVARRWKGQVSEIAKAWGQFEVMPESDHNALAGIFNPEELFAHAKMIFLRAPSDHPRNRLRAELTRKAFMLQGIDTDLIEAVGETPLAQQWTALHLGDYIAFYLAMAYGVDPTPVESIESFKEEMAGAR